MAHLTLNGVELEVSVRTGERTWEDLGDEARAIDGTFLSTRTKAKRRWDCTTPPLTLAEADAWAALLLGRGDTWKFLTEYSDKGLAKTSASGTADYNVAAGKFAKKIQLGATEYVRWTLTGDDALVAGGLNPLGDYTLSVWRLETGTWYHYIVRNAASTITRYKDGVTHVGATAWLAVTAGVLQLGDGTNADDFSDLVAVPFAIPVAWAPTWAAYARAFPALPRLEASGTMLSSPTTPVSVRARNLRETPEPTVADAVSKRLDFVLVEV